ncbi:MAG: ATP-grasp domain-containing protein [Propionibacteriaceae bacterium]|jgi:acetyl-CoA/propionyl-CoA carboxylase biotin carboxyl carrier protein|nr:ATP-grasp domain-containing protein [Propionibacteriaceae bacterium]
MKKVLIANRGEIAVRVIHACASYGLKSVAVYADSDANALHVRLADEAFCLEGRSALETYLDADKILAAARASGADAIHPGYGFLSERADFAQAVEDAGLTWIGPTPENIALLGDKVAARRIAESVGAPLVPGTAEPVAGAKEVRAFAEAYGYPIAIKAAFGGGGRGFKVVRRPEELELRYESAVSEAVSAFGRGECYVERFVNKPRHVETQVLGDGRGRVVVVGTRDCSLQRRHQKVLEEGPAPFLTPAQFEQLVSASRAIGEAVNYRGAGTMEFMLGDDGLLSFLEVNTRIQVEHPVTERTTGIDLVVWQFRIAEGEPLDELPDVLPSQGHAIEFRINAEDAGRGFLPQAGHMTRFDMPLGPFTRIDAGITAGEIISPEFDSMIAKVIVWGVDRAEAIARGRLAMKECVIEGIPSLVDFHRRILEEPGFLAVEKEDFTIHTNWIETECTWLGDLAKPLPKGVVREEIIREWFEVDGRWIRLGFPAALVGTGGRGTAAPKPAAAAETGGIRAAMNGVLSRWSVAAGTSVVAGQTLGTLEAMKMEMAVVADKGGVFTPAVPDNTPVKEGQVLGMIA